jgi:hypothetical protein
VQKCCQTTAATFTQRFTHKQKSIEKALIMLIRLPGVHCSTGPNRQVAWVLGIRSGENPTTLQNYAGSRVKADVNRRMGS